MAPGRRAGHNARVQRAAPVHDVEVAIVGAGFSGIGMAIRLDQAGRPSYVMLEKSGDVGGVWLANRYPGCACDVASHLYAFSFEPNPSWSRKYSPQAEIQGYLRHCVEKHDLRDRLRLRTEVTEAAFDESDGRWRVHTRGPDGDAGLFRARYLVLAIGALSRPALPDLPGLASFRGRVLHSAQWEAAPLDGLRVAVVGTGASAIQLIPRLAPVVSRLLVFQRTAPWVIPRGDRDFTTVERWLLRASPLVRRLYRWWIYWSSELYAVAFTRAPWMLAVVEHYARRHVRRQIKDPELRRRVTPDYRAGCKRILLSDDYYPALARPNVELISHAVSRITETGVVTPDGTEHTGDAIVFATGFRVTAPLAPLRVVGRGGLELNEAWRNGMEAYLGTMVAGFPNLFLPMGPNTGLGHSSMVFMLEAQLRYMLDHMRIVEARGSAFADVRPEVQAAYNASLEARLARTIWASGCRSWYLDARGRNTTLWPGFTFGFWWRTARADPACYEFQGVRSGGTAP